MTQQRIKKKSKAAIEYHQHVIEFMELLEARRGKEDIRAVLELYTQEFDSIGNPAANSPLLDYPQGTGSERSASHNARTMARSRRLNQLC